MSSDTDKTGGTEQDRIDEAGQAPWLQAQWADITTLAEEPTTLFGSPESGPMDPERVEPAA
jgi:hypothetical protein